MTHEYAHYIDLSMFSPSDGFPEPLDPAKSANRILAYARELEARVKELENCGVVQMMIWNSNVDSFVHEYEKRVSDLERQLAEATTWRSPETAPRDGTWIIGRFDADVRGIIHQVVRWQTTDDGYQLWMTANLTIYGNPFLIEWLPLPETKKEDV